MNPHRAITPLDCLAALQSRQAARHSLFIEDGPLVESVWEGTILKTDIRRVPASRRIVVVTGYSVQFRAIVHTTMPFVGMG
jgi:hypothetical protein